MVLVCSVMTLKPGYPSFLGHHRRALQIEWSLGQTSLFQENGINVPSFAFITSCISFEENEREKRPRVPPKERCPVAKLSTFSHKALKTRRRTITYMYLLIHQFEAGKRFFIESNEGRISKMVFSSSLVFLASSTSLGEKCNSLAITSNMVLLESNSPQAKL